MRTGRVLFLTGPRTVDLREVEIPDPGPGELLLKIDAATTCGTDLKVFLRGGHPRMLRPPCPFGHEISGTIAAAGPGARWREGDAVVVANSAPCGRCRFCRAGRENLCPDLRYLNGAFADFLLVPQAFGERAVYNRPPGLDPGVAALAEPLACVLHGLSRCDPSESEECVVIGAGPIGLMWVSELSGIGRRVVLGDLVDRRLETGRRLGAAATIRLEGNATDARRLRAATASGKGAPLVVEATGVPAAWTTAMETVETGGEVVLFGGCVPGTTVDLDTHRLHYSEITVRGVYHHRPATFKTAMDHLSDGTSGFEALIETRCGLDGVANVLERMAAREILKAVVVP